MNKKIGYIAIRQNLEEIKKIRKKDVSELISLDTILCPSAIDELVDADYENKIYENIFHDIFSDIDYLSQRISNDGSVLLAVVPDPFEKSRVDLQKEGYQFAGYDLVEDESRISALLNCQHLRSIFVESDYNKFSLISNYDRAVKLQNKLLNRFPEDNHANCRIWAIGIVKGKK